MIIKLTQEQQEEMSINEFFINEVKSFVNRIDDCNNRIIKVSEAKLYDLLYSLKEIEKDLKEWDEKDM